MENEKFAWELFKNTGSIDAYLMMKQVEQGEKMQGNTTMTSPIVGEKHGNSQNKGNCHKNH